MKSKVPLDAVDTRGFTHVEGDHGVVKEEGAVVGLNEAHAAHVGSKVEHMLCSFRNLKAILHNTKVHKVKLVTEHILTHVLILLPIGSDDVVTLTLQAARNVRRDEPPSARDGDSELLRRPVLLAVQVRGRVRSKAAIALHVCKQKPAPKKSQNPKSKILAQNSTDAEFRS